MSDDYRVYLEAKVKVEVRAEDEEAAVERAIVNLELGLVWPDWQATRIDILG